MKTENGFIIMDDQYQLRYKLYIPGEIYYIALSVHGGCFQDGDETWNKDQSESLAQEGILVMQLNFRQTSIKQTLSDLTSGYAFLKNKYNNLKYFNNYANSPFGIIGCSSGGYHAIKLTIMSQMKFDFCILLCPVSNPYKRYEYLSNSDHENKHTMMMKQMKFFKTERLMKLGSSYIKNFIANTPTFVIIGDKDTNVPICVNEYLLSRPKMHYMILDGGHELCYKYNKKVTDSIIFYLDMLKKKY